MSELKPLPCPFCGGAGEDLITNEYYIPAEGFAELKRWFIHCQSCGCKIDWLKTREKAIAAWNRRTQPNQLPTATKLMPSEPLTLEELRGMDGERVWVQFRGMGMYALVAYHADPDGDDGDDVYLTNNLGGRSTVEEIYDQGGDIYRRKPEGD